MIKVIISDDRMRYTTVDQTKPSSSNFNLTKLNFKIKDMFDTNDSSNSAQNKHSQSVKKSVDLTPNASQKKNVTKILP